LSHKHSTKTTKIKLTRKTTKTRHRQPQPRPPPPTQGSTGQESQRSRRCYFTTSPGVEMPQDARVHYPIHKVPTHQPRTQPHPPTEMHTTRPHEGGTHPKAGRDLPDG